MRAARLRCRWVDRHVHDVLVVGGGIHGLATALDAAARGLTVALVEAGRLRRRRHRSTTSAPRTAACGRCRSGRLGHARESIRERRALARIAPRLLRPLPFIVGTYRSSLKSRLALRAAFRIDTLARAGIATTASSPSCTCPTAAADVARRDAEALPGRPPGRPDRRRELVRLPDRPGRTA